MLQIENIHIFYFGSPGNGFMSLPTKFSNEISAFDKSDKKLGDLDSYYLKKSNHVDIIYVLYGLGGEGDNSYRGGRNFGVGIRLDEVEIKESDRNLLFDFLHRFIYEGINQPKAGIFKNNNGTIAEYSISSFRQKEDVLKKLAQNVSSQFLIEFRDSTSPIVSKKSLMIELDPDKIRVIKEEREKKGDQKSVGSKVELRENTVTSITTNDNSTNNSINANAKSDKSYTWLLWFITLGSLLFSGYNYYRSIQTNIRLKEVIIAGSKKGASNMVSDTVQGLTIRIKKCNGKNQYYWNTLIAPSVKTAYDKKRVNNISDVINSLAKFSVESKQLPRSASKAKVQEFILNNNENDLSIIKSTLSELLQVNSSRGVFMSDLNISSDFIIWQEK